MLPCPRSANHLVVSDATKHYIFGPAFAQHYEHKFKSGVARQRPIYELARKGFEGLFTLTTPDAQHVQRRLAELKTKTQNPSSVTPSAPIVGVHIRHGDNHPAEYQYQHGWIPLTSYISAAESMINASASSVPALQHALIVTASDDPDVYASDEIASAAFTTSRAQERISLASHSQSKISSTPSTPLRPGVARKFKEATVGWEGGFFSGMFWSLGHAFSTSRPQAPIYSTTSRFEGPVGQHPGALAKEEQYDADDDTVDRALSIPDARSTVPPTAEALRLRELLGRSYLLDLAVVAQSDGVVCAISAMGCRLLGVMMGWEQAFEQGSGRGWRNIDGWEDWRGLDP